MHGEEMGTLNIYQQTTTGQQLETLRSLLFTMTGDQGSDWRLAAITLPDAQSFVVSCLLFVTLSFRKLNRNPGTDADPSSMCSIKCQSND